MRCTLAKFGLPFEKATPLVHFPKALKRPRNNAGPAGIGLLMMKGMELLIRKGIGLLIGFERYRLGGHDMAESSQLTSHKKQIEQDVSSDMPPTSVVKREHRRHETQL